MLMDKRLSPNTWDEIASQRKTEADWTCVACGRSCRRPDYPCHACQKENAQTWTIGAAAVRGGVTVNKTLLIK